MLENSVHNKNTTLMEWVQCSVRAKMIYFSSAVRLAAFEPKIIYLFVCVCWLQFHFKHGWTRHTDVSIVHAWNSKSFFLYSFSYHYFCMFRKREKLLYDTSVSAGKIGTSEPHMHTCREAGWMCSAYWTVQTQWKLWKMHKDRLLNITWN